MSDRRDRDTDTLDSSPDVAPDGSLVDADRETPADNRPPLATRLRRRLGAQAAVMRVSLGGLVRNTVRLAALVLVCVAAYNAVFAPVGTLPVWAPYRPLTELVIGGYAAGAGQAFFSHILAFVAGAIVVWKV